MSYRVPLLDPSTPSTNMWTPLLPAPSKVTVTVTPAIPLLAASYPQPASGLAPASVRIYGASAIPSLIAHAQSASARVYSASAIPSLVVDSDREQLEDEEEVCGCHSTCGKVALCGTLIAMFVLYGAVAVVAYLQHKAL